jgi:hypothetical protein
MQEKLHKKLVAETEKLRRLVAGCSFDEITGYVGAKFISWPEEDIGLSSPHKQLFFLLGLTMSTPEPAIPNEFDEAEWEKARVLLESISCLYGFMYWPSADETDQIDERWHSDRKLAMPAFLHYFNSGLMASTEQVKNRIRGYLFPFDETIRSVLGLGVSQMLTAADSVFEILQRGFDALTEAKQNEESARLQILDLAQKEGWDDEMIRSYTSASGYGVQADALLAALSKVLKLELTDLVATVGQDLAFEFWRLFTSTRGESSSFTYLTDANPAEDRPIFLIGRDIASVPSPHSVYLAVLSVTERALMNSDRKDSFLRHRDKTLQNETEKVFKGFFGSSAKIVAGAYETPDQQHEHDIIVYWNRRLFAVEAKASPPVVPFRDPARASVRIRRAFASDRGIQKAYDQAHRIEIALKAGYSPKLYNRSGEVLLDLSAIPIDRVYCICVTRDNFGLLASDLSLLLNKDLAYPYPWAINILDLESLFDALSYFGWGPERFCEYLEGREKMHGKIIAFDELEFAGYLIEHGTFDYMFDGNCDKSFLNPSYTEVLTRVHLAKLGGKPVKYAPHPPVSTNLSSEVRKWQAESILGNKESLKPRDGESRQKQGRNQKCACGSGLKYKHCCGP